MIEAIDSFRIHYEVYSITFIRIGDRLAWYGMIQSEPYKYGDFITSTRTGRVEALVNDYYLLAAQAAESLVLVTKRKEDYKPLLDNLRKGIKEYSS